MHELPWIEPLEMARGVPKSEASWALLYSGLRVPYTGRYSYLALHPAETLTADDFTPLAKRLSRDKSALENAWFGYLGYGLRHCLEKLPFDKQGFINLPPLWLTRYKTILQFDHERKKIEAWGTGPHPAPLPKGEGEKNTIIRLESNMSKAEYLGKVEEIRQAILAGDLCQANLTRKFFGEFEKSPSPFALFSTLCTLSPAPYSAFLKLDKDTYILSSSPERFLTVDHQGHAESRPIKGSAPRGKNSREDKTLRENLQKSEKDRAENLMIVDLMRNDFSRTAEIGSVKVESLFDISTYETIHHMSSTIRAVKRAEVGTLEMVKGCFPPGSMTGTPKIRAMELCSQLEGVERGVYSGALGWFGGDGSCDLSVVIRTLILQGKKFEFQAGGAIVADSDPESEWRETLTKASAISATLGLEPGVLEGL